jgi:hypothetical protein
MIRGVLMLAAARTIATAQPPDSLDTSARTLPDRAVEGARVESAVGGVRRVACTALLPLHDRLPKRTSQSGATRGVRVPIPARSQ